VDRQTERMALGNSALTAINACLDIFFHVYYLLVYSVEASALRGNMPPHCWHVSMISNYRLKTCNSTHMSNIIFTTVG